MAEPVKLNGIYYNLIGSNAEVIQNPNSYSGNVSIPPKIVVDGKTYDVTRIGDEAFKFCVNLIAVSLPNTIIEIGREAFRGCNQITSFTIPTSTQKIDFFAFAYCNKLKSLTIPSNVKSIGDDAFESCMELESVIIEEGVESIGEYAFVYCQELKNISFPNSVTYVGSCAFMGTTWLNNHPDEIIYVGKTLYYCKGLLAENSSVEVREGTCCISGYAFNGQKGLVEIVIPSSVTFVGGDAFDGTTWLENHKDGAIYAGSVLYRYKGDLTVGSEIDIKEGTVWIADGAFKSKYGLELIKFPESLTGIGNSVFQNCNYLKSANIPNNVKCIGDYAFENCSAMENLTFGPKVNNIGVNAFRGCYSLNTIRVDEGCTAYDSRDNCNAIIETATNKLIVGGNKSTIPEGVTSIGDCAFKDCKGLTEVAFPNSLTSIGQEAFSGCSLKSLSIGSGLINIEKGSFSAVDLLSITVDKANPVYDSRDNCNAIIVTALDSLVLGCQTTVIPNSVTIIGDHAFENIANLKTIKIPNSVKYIADGAFERSGLTAVEIPGSVKVIGWDAFRYCEGLTSINIPEGVYEIKGGAFSFCTKLENIELSSTVEAVGYGAFEYTSWYNNQPDGMVYIGNIAYKYKGDMPANSHIEIKDGTIGIAGQAFANQSNLKSIDFPNSLRTIGEYAFSGCVISTLVLGEHLSLIGMHALPIDKLKDVYCYAKEAPNYIDPGWGNTYNTLLLHVPYASISKYKNSGMWKYFSIVALTDDDPVPTRLNTITTTDSRSNIWYDLNGRKLDAEPCTKGIYINNGKKVVK